MPIMDDTLLLMESAAITGSAAATVISTNNIYLPQVKDHKGTLGNDRAFLNGDMHFNCVVEDQALDASGGSATLTIRLMEHTAAITASNLASATQVIEVPAITVTSASSPADGTLLCSIPLPPGQRKPYLAATFAIATKKITAGKVTAWIGPATQQGT